MSSEWWVSSPKVTVWVATDGSCRIYAIAPIGRKFLGQPLWRFVNWLERISSGPVQWEEL